MAAYKDTVIGVDVAEDIVKISIGAETYHVPMEMIEPRHSGKKKPIEILLQNIAIRLALDGKELTTENLKSVDGQRFKW